VPGGGGGAGETEEGCVIPSVVAPVGEGAGEAVIGKAASAAVDPIDGLGNMLMFVLLIVGAGYIADMA